MYESIVLGTMWCYLIRQSGVSARTRQATQLVDCGQQQRHLGEPAFVEGRGPPNPCSRRHTCR